MVRLWANTLGLKRGLTNVLLVLPIYYENKRERQSHRGLVDKWPRTLYANV